MLPWIFIVLCLWRVGDVFILMYWMALLDDRWDWNAIRTSTELCGVLLRRLAFAVLSIVAGTAGFFVTYAIFFVFVQIFFPPQPFSEGDTDDTYGLLLLVSSEVPALTALHAWLLRRVYGTAWVRAIAIGLLYVLCFMAMWIFFGFLAIRSIDWNPPGP